MNSVVVSLKSKKLLTLFFSLYTISLLSSLSGMEIFSSLLMIAMIAVIFINKRSQANISVPPFWKPILLFTLIAIIGIFINESSLAQKRYDVGRFRFFIWYFCLYYYLSYIDSEFRWFKPLLSISAVVAVYGFIQHFHAIDLIRPEGKKVLMYAIQDEKIGPLVVGFFNHHLTFSNIISFHACLWFSLGIHQLEKKPVFKNWPLLLGSLFFLLGFWTQSRAAWAALPLMILVLLWSRGKKFILWGIVSLALLMTCFYAFDAGFKERFDRTFLQQNDEWNLGPRQRLWAVQWDLIRLKPFFGVGYNNNERMAKQILDKKYPGQNNFSGHAHSTPLQILATTGILGFLAYVWIWAAIFHRLGKVLKSQPKDSFYHALAIAACAGFIGFHIQGITQWNFGDAEVLHNLLFFWAITAILPTSRTEKTPPFPHRVSLDN